MSTASFPLLDAFTQQLRDFNYNAVTNWSRFFNISPAISLFTYNTGDEEVEQKVIDHVGSYGSQLSRILKMLDLLERHTQLTGLIRPIRAIWTSSMSSTGIHGPPSPSTRRARRRR